VVALIGEWTIRVGGYDDSYPDGCTDGSDLQEPLSLNTYENAVNVREILDARGIRRVLLVTSAMHMPRALLIFKRQVLQFLHPQTCH